MSSSRGGRGGGNKSNSQAARGKGRGGKGKRNKGASNGKQKSHRKSGRGGKKPRASSSADGDNLVADGTFELSGKLSINTDPIEQRLEQIQQTLDDGGGKKRPWQKGKGAPAAAKNNGGRKGKAAEAAGGDSATLKPLDELSLEDLLSTRFAAGVEISMDADALTEVKDAIKRPLFPMYSFDPVQDVRSTENSVNSAHKAHSRLSSSSDGRHSDSSNSSTYRNAVERLIEGDLVPVGHCFESLPQTMWWYIVTIDAPNRPLHSASILPPLLPMSNQTLLNYAKNRKLTSKVPSLLATAISLRKTMWTYDISWGMPLQRITNNPGAPLLTDVNAARTAMYYYHSLVGCVYPDGGEDMLTELVAAFACTWQDNAPTVQEYRGFLSMLVAKSMVGANGVDGHGELSLRGTLDRLLRETDEMSHELVIEALADDDYVRSQRNLIRTVQWIAHCMVYSPRRGFTPGRFYGAASCRWYLAADEETATGASDFCPVTTGRPLSYAETSERAFIGGKRAEYQRLSTSRVAVHGDGSAATLQEIVPGFYNALRGHFVANARLLMMERDKKMDTAAVQEEELEGVPEIEPDGAEISYRTTLPLDRKHCGGEYSAEEKSEFLEDSHNSEEVRHTIDRERARDYGVSSAAMMNNSESCPHYRTFDEIHDQITRSHSFKRTYKYSEIRRTRLLGEAMHQWARDLASIRYWILETGRLRAMSSGPTAMLGSTPFEASPYPDGAYRHSHMYWFEEVVRVAYEVYFRRALVYKHDEKMLSADFEADAACRVCAKLGDESVARKMFPCAVRRSLGLMGITSDEVRIGFWSLLSFVHGQFERNGRTAGSGTPAGGSGRSNVVVRNSRDYHQARKLLPFFSATIVAYWIRLWARMENVEIAEEGVFKKHTARALYAHKLAPMLKCDVVDRMLSEKRVTDWDGSWFNRMFMDSHYVWADCDGDEAFCVFESIASHVSDRLVAISADVVKLATEMNFSNLLDQRTRVEQFVRAALVPEHTTTTTTSSRPDELDRNARTAMALMLGTGMLSERTASSLGRRYYVDVFNSIVVNARQQRGRSDIESVPSQYVALYGFLSKVVPDQFSSSFEDPDGEEERLSFYRLFSNASRYGDDPYRTFSEIMRALYRPRGVAMSRYSASGALAVSNMAELRESMSRSIIAGVGLVSMIASPIRQHMWTADIASVTLSRAEGCGNSLLEMANSTVSDIFQIPGGKMPPSMEDYFAEESSSQRDARLMFYRVNMESALRQAQVCQLSSYAAMNLSIGDSRRDLYGYIVPGGFIDSVRTLSMAPPDLRAKIGAALRNFDRAWLYFQYDKALLHGYVPYVRRRLNQVEDIQMQARISRLNNEVFTAYGKDEFDRASTSGRSTYRYNLRKLRNTLQIEEFSGAWTFVARDLESYFWSPNLLDERYDQRPTTNSIIFLEGRNEQTGYNTGLILYELSPRKQHYVSYDFMTIARSLARRAPELFAPRLNRNGNKLDSNVHINGRIGVKLTPPVAYVGAESQSLKPYPLRVPGVDYAVSDAVSNSPTEDTLRVLYSVHATYRGEEAYVMSLFDVHPHFESPAGRGELRELLAAAPIEPRYVYKYSAADAVERRKNARANTFNIEVVQSYRGTE